MSPAARSRWIGVAAGVGVCIYAPVAFTAAVFAAVGALWPIAALLVLVGLIWAAGAIAALAAAAVARPLLAVAGTLLLVIPTLIAAVSIVDTGDWGPWSIVPVLLGLVAAAALWMGVYGDRTAPAAGVFVLCGAGLGASSWEDAYVVFVPLAAVAALAVAAHLVARPLRPPAGSPTHAP